MGEASILDMIRKSSLYRRILGEGVKAGELREAREILIKQGTRRFGEANPSTSAALALIDDIHRLEAMCDGMIEPELRGWDDLFRDFSPPPDEPNLSSTCERIFREGREIGRLQVLRRLLRRAGARRFGAPHLETSRRIQDIQDPARLEAMAERLVDEDLETWTDLLSEA